MAKRKREKDGGYFWGSWGRGPTQLGVAEKRVNGIVVGYQVGFIGEDLWLCSIRKNLLFKTESEAFDCLNRIEENSHEEGTRPMSVVIKSGESRY